MARNGKIARLPREIREALNRRLQDGDRGAPLLAWLNARPEVAAVLAREFDGSAISKQNLCEWRNGGFTGWQARQEALTQARELAADATELAAATDGRLTDHLATVLAARYAAALAGWNGEVNEDFRRKLRALRGLCQDIVELRRGDHSGARLNLERERLEREREKSEEVVVAQFEDWARNPAVRDWICQAWITPEERRRRLREIFGRPPEEAAPTASESKPVKPNPTQNDPIKPDETSPLDPDLVQTLDPRAQLLACHPFRITYPSSRMTTANKVTILRILLVPFFVVEVLYYVKTGNELHRVAALLTFAVAAICDGVDGYIARHYHQWSELGTILDPLADKLLLVSGVVLLSFDHGTMLGQIPYWLAGTIIGRDLLVLIGLVVIRLTVGKVKIRPHFVGKVATVLQMVTVLWLLLKWDTGAGMRWASRLTLGAAICTGVSALLYVRDGMRQLSASPSSLPSEPPRKVE